MFVAEWAAPEFEAALVDLNISDEINAENKRITSAQLARIIEAAPRDGDTRVLVRPRFRGALFDGDATFSGVRFEGEAVFDGAEFGGFARFSDAEFQSWAMFANATFRSNAEFSEARFVGNAVFMGAQVRDGSIALFDGARFSLDANFNRVRLLSAQFNRAEFLGRLLSVGASCSRDMLFINAVFRAPVDIGPMLIGRRLVVDGAIFEEDGQIKASTPQLSCIRTRFVGRADLKLRWRRSCSTTPCSRGARGSPAQQLPRSAGGERRVPRRIPGRRTRPTAAGTSATTLGPRGERCEPQPERR